MKEAKMNTIADGKQVQTWQFYQQLQFNFIWLYQPLIFVPPIAYLGELTPNSHTTWLDEANIYAKFQKDLDINKT